jgi:protein arginine N-methyltransferase 5
MQIYIYSILLIAPILLPGLSALLINISRSNNANLSRIIYAYIMKCSGPQIWLRIPIAKIGSLSHPGDAGEDTWSWWDTFRCNANFEKRLCLALEIVSADALPDEESIKRWLGEPIKALVINTR